MLQTTCRQCKFHRLVIDGTLARKYVPLQQRRPLLTLAIETSCDDTSVAVLEQHKFSTQDGQPRATLHFHKKVTADNNEYGGLNPLVSLASHQQNLAFLVQEALRKLPFSKKEPGNRQKPDFISVTRGPGMRTSVSTGLDTAKGLAVAYGVPLLGVNHMQAHALTPRLVSALEGKMDPEPEFPFLSLLISGGHTMILRSESLIRHRILASTTDVAIGDALDKMARVILPRDAVHASEDVSYARVLESFVFPPDIHYSYNAPANRNEETTRRRTKWGWSLSVPFAETRGGKKTRCMEMSFSGLDSGVRRTVSAREEAGGLTIDERRELGYEAMRLSFEHVAGRSVLALDMLENERRAASNNVSTRPAKIRTLVASGGVAANKFLRVVLRKFLNTKGYSDVQIEFPPLELCTDNAAMIAWAGIEMYQAGWQTRLDCTALRKWSLDPQAEDGGILGVGGWHSRSQDQAVLQDTNL